MDTFLAGVVRKKLGLNLVSEQTDKGRVYRIKDGKASSAGSSAKNRAPQAFTRGAVCADLQLIPQFSRSFSVALSRPNGALWLPKTNAGSSTILCDELDAGLSEGTCDCAHGILGNPDAAIGFCSLDSRNG